MKGFSVFGVGPLCVSRTEVVWGNAFRSGGRACEGKPVWLLLPLLIPGCGKLDYYSPVPVPDLVRQPPPVDASSRLPDITAMAKSYGRSLFATKPDQIEISQPIYDAQRRAYSACVRVSDPSQPGMYVGIGMGGFTGRRPSVPSDQCQEQTYATVVTD